MKKHYPYRFRLESEFLSEFGENWRNEIDEMWNSDGEMDHLLGQPYPYFINKDAIYLEDVDNNRWSVSWDMLIENEPIVPDYKPKEKIIRSLSYE